MMGRGCLETERSHILVGILEVFLCPLPIYKLLYSLVELLSLSQAQAAIPPHSLRNHPSLPNHQRHDFWLIP